MLRLLTYTSVGAEVQLGVSCTLPTPPPSASTAKYAPFASLSFVQHTHMLFGVFLVDYDISLYDMLAHLLTRRRKSNYEGWLMFDSYQHLLSTTASLRSAESTGPVLPLQTDIQHVCNQSAWRGRLSTPQMTCLTVRDRWQVSWSLVITWLSNSCCLVGGGKKTSLVCLSSDHVVC